MIAITWMMHLNSIQGAFPDGLLFHRNFHKPSHFLRAAVSKADTILLLSSTTAIGDDDELEMLDSRVIVTAHEVYDIARTESFKVLQYNLWKYAYLIYYSP